MPRDILSGCKILATVTYATKAKALAEPRRAESRYALIFMFLSIKSGRGIYATHSAPVSPWSLATLLGRRTPLAATSSRFPDLSESWCCHGCCCRLLATNEASKDAAKSRGNASLRATNYSATVGTTMPGWRRSMGSWEGPLLMAGECRSHWHFLRSRTHSAGGGDRWRWNKGQSGRGNASAIGCSKSKSVCAPHGIPGATMDRHHWRRDHAG